jgi:hypothetical protein
MPPLVPLKVCAGRLVAADEARAVPASTAPALATTAAARPMCLMRMMFLPLGVVPPTP